MRLSPVDVTWSGSCLRACSLLRVMGKGITQSSGPSPVRIKALLGFFCSIYRRRVLGGVVSLDGNEVRHRPRGS